MKYCFYFLVVLFFTCCKKSENVTSKGELPKDCFNPENSIHKFATLDSDSLYLAITKTLEADHISLTADDKAALKQWTDKKVMGSVFPDENIVEWNIYDEDFCKNRITLIRDTEGKLIDSVSIQTCNTKLNKDVSCGANWSTKLKSTPISLSIQYCNKIIRTQKRVGYYEIVNKNDKLERTSSNYQFKRDVVTDVYFTYINTNNAQISKKICTDNAVLYDQTPPDAK
jgi:hypothetical protein